MDTKTIIPKLPIFNRITKETNIPLELDELFSKQLEFESHISEYGYEDWTQYDGPENPYLVVIGLSPQKVWCNESEDGEEETHNYDPYEKLKDEISRIDVPTGYYYLYPFPIIKDAEIPASHKEFHLSFFKHRMKLLKPSYILLLGSTAWKNCISFISKKKLHWIYESK